MVMMSMYKEMYFTLFNALTDAIEQMEAQQFDRALRTLEQAQQAAEERYLLGEEGEQITDHFTAR